MTTPVLKQIADLLADSSGTMAAARRETLQIVLSDPERALNESFEALAERANTSVPTIMRAVRELGFAGLREFKLALAQELAVSGSPLHRRVQLHDDTAQVVSKVIKSAAAAVNGVQAQLSPQALEAAADAFVAAQRVDCWCVGATSSFMAADMQARLFRMGLVANAYLDQHLQLVSAATLQAGSVAFAISHVGGMPSLLEAVEVARGQGATVIALTQAGTPLAKLADIVIAIQVPDDPVMHVGTEAYLAHLTVLEVLTVLIAQRLGDSVVQRLADVRKVLSTHGLDTRHHPLLNWGES
ncbi:MurR/RpiR family transcriptional regulator [Roseateles toxinivorans]|uniref:RpiR family transcriptional regulator n=1 Tax=Roseateles toxinivorans TaxID=270368 RepID=A0A4R6QP34_9BURK|nr:MurR/RpiR family transcriptional regulator [Roseateles toxinivorans]TDP64251.1 RpiR family transcriptional regulator [Roseateles toxinivorans]